MERKSLGRRRSRSFGLVSDEVCETIDPSFSQHERLSMLLQYAVDTAFIKAENEITDDINNKVFDDKRTECTIQIETRIVELDLCKRATIDAEVLSTSMNDDLQEYNAAIERLEKEKKSWDEILAKFKNRASERELESLTLKEDLDLTEFNPYNYSEVLQDVVLMKENFNFKVHEFENKCKKLLNSTQQAKEKITLIQDEAQDYFSNSSDETPRRLIKKCS